MRHLLLLRHAKSAWDDTDLPDHDRPLNKRGLSDAPRIGRLLAELQIVPDLILTSTAVRAEHTAQLAAEAAGVPHDRIDSRRNLYHAEPDQLLESARTAADGVHRLMIVSHNPGMEELLARLSGRHIRFPTAALAHLAFPIDRWRDLSDQTAAQLLEVYRPKEM